MPKLIKLQYICKQLGIKQYELAKLIGCNPGNFSSRVNGRVSTTYDEMLTIKEEINKLAKSKGFVEYTLDDIFGE